MKVDQTTFESHSRKRKLRLAGFIGTGVFLMLAMLAWFIFFVHGLKGSMFDGLPMDVHFYWGTKEFVLGKSTVGEMLDQRVGLEMETADKTKVVGQNGTYQCKLKTRWDQVVFFTFRNTKGHDASIRDCVIDEISVLNPDGVEKYIRFDFPLENSQYCVRKSAGEPTFSSGAAGLEMWLYQAVETGTPGYFFTFDRGYVESMRVWIER